MSAIAHLSSEQMLLASHLHTLYDTDQTGHMSSSSATAATRVVCPAVDVSLIQALVEPTHPATSKEIPALDFQQFLQMLVAPVHALVAAEDAEDGTGRELGAVQSLKSEIDELWHLFDTDGDGMITPRDLQSAAAELACHVSEPTARTMLAAANPRQLPQLNRIDFESFLRLQ